MNITSRVLETQNQMLGPPPLSDAWTHDEVREELTRILRSRFFIKSMRLSCFLSTAVDYFLAGKADSFKEYTVGTEVYGRSADYDPTEDTIVRTEARRLRAKLKEYYSHSLGPHRLRISVVAGSYVPVIEVGYASKYDDRLETVSPIMIPLADGSLSVAVISFNAKAMEPTSQHVASKLEEELTHELTQKPNVKVFRIPSDGWSASVDQFYRWSRSGIRFALRGFVHQSPDGPFAQIQLTTIQGMILWSARFSGDSLLSQSNEIASAVCNSFLSSTSHGDRFEAPTLSPIEASDSTP